MGKCQKAALLLNEEELAALKKILNSTSCPYKEVQRAKILCAYYKKESILSKKVSYRWKAGLKDLPHSKETQ